MEVMKVKQVVVIVGSQMIQHLHHLQHHQQVNNPQQVNPNPHK